MNSTEFELAFTLLPVANVCLMLTSMVKPFAKVMFLLKPKRRWAQLSLRTLFLLVTLLCAALGMWVVPAERQQRCVAAIRAVGGEIYYADYGQKTPDAFPITLLRRWLPRDYVDEVHQVHFYSAPVTDEALIHLQGMKGLRALHLGDPKITDVGLAHLERLTNLEWLNLDGTQITDAGLVHLLALKRLKCLDVESTQVTDAGIAQLEQALPNCAVYGPRRGR